MVKNFLKIAFFVFISSFFILLILTNSFSNIRASITDALHGNKDNLDNIIIIKIDDKSINEIGRWPWDRDVFAQILMRLKTAKTIGVDLSFFEKSSDDFLLNKTLNGVSNVVLAAEVQENTLYAPIFNSDFGYVNLIIDNDGIVRSLRGDAIQETIPFSFKVYEKAFNKKVSGEKSVYLINFPSAPGGFNSISVAELLNRNFSFENKLVFLGATAFDLHDTFIVPTSRGVEMSGVEIQATILQNLILDNFITKQNSLLTLLLVFFMGLIGIFYLSKLKIYLLAPIILLSVVIYSFFGIFIFQKFNYVIDFFFVPLSLIIFTGTGIGINYIEERKYSGYITDAFGRYVNKDLLKELTEKMTQLKLGGEKKTITVFFSDIRDFTSISEKLAPEKLGNLINDYLTVMTDIVLQHKGTIDKFIGDSIMAFWNAPLSEKEHEELACKTAIAQFKALKEFNEKLSREKQENLRIGCGIHTGGAIVGNFGSKDRFSYTAIGDTVNISSRLEGLTKYYKVGIIISETTFSKIKDKFNCRKLDAVKVKGKTKPLIIYELCVDYDEDYRKFVNQYEKALELYFKSRFKEAEKEFEKALNLKKEDHSSKFFMERCENYIKNPPEKGWDGSYEMKEK